MNLARACPKPSFKRISLTRKQRSEATPKVRAEVKHRSNGVCEKCDAARSTELAHIERRWKSESRPTQFDFIDLCDDCHTWCDSCTAGREWLAVFQIMLLEQEEIS